MLKIINLGGEYENKLDFTYENQGTTNFLFSLKPEIK